MTELALSQLEADKLIALAKTFLKKYSANLTDGFSDHINIISKSTTRRFKLFYHYQKKNCHLNFMDCDTNLNLVRINLNDSFHKNADGTYIRGNRVNLFCEDEYSQREDGQYMRAYKLPYKNLIKNPKDFLEALDELLKYTNVKDYKSDLNLVVQKDLF